MELDDFKSAWVALDRRLALDHALKLQDLRDRKLGGVARSLRPLAWGQVALIAFGIAMLLLGVGTWTGHRENVPLFVAGLCLHVYGVLTIIAGGRTLALIRSIDYAAPVLTIQRQLVTLRRWYIGSGAVTGLAWWLLWMPFIMCLGKVNLWANAPSVIWIGAGIGVVGLLTTWAFHRWVQRPARAQLAKTLDDGAAGRSIVRAQSSLAELARFEQES